MKLVYSAIACTRVEEEATFIFAHRSLGKHLKNTIMGQRNQTSLFP